MANTLHLQAIRTALREVEHLGGKVPKAAHTEYAMLNDIIDRAAEFKDALGCDIGAAVVAALEAGADPLADAAVQQAATRHALSETQQSIDWAIDARTQRYIEDHGLSLLAAFGDPFDRAATDITAAVDLLGPVDPVSAQGIARRNPEAAAAWARVQAAQDTITQIIQVWKTLQAVVPTMPTLDKRYRLLIIADVPASVFVAEGLAGLDVTPWDAACRGWPLSYADPSTYRQRVAAIGEAMTKREADHAAAFSEGYQRAHGIGLPKVTAPA